MISELGVAVTLQSMAVGVPGRHGQRVRPHVEGASRVARGCATAPTPSMAAGAVWERTPTATSVTRWAVPSVGSGTHAHTHAHTHTLSVCINVGMIVMSLHVPCFGTMSLNILFLSPNVEQ